MAGLEARKVEREALSKEERLKQIQRMRDRLNQHTANQNRDASTKTISENTKRFMREKGAQIQSQEKGREPSAPAR